MCMACLSEIQASERVGQPSSGQQEGALYGVLAGNVERVLPACASWQDATWALTRRSGQNIALRACTTKRYVRMRAGCRELSPSRSCYGLGPRCSVSGSGFACVLACKCKNGQNFGNMHRSRKSMDKCQKHHKDPRFCSNASLHAASI